MKKFTKLITALLGTVLVLGSLGACGNSNSSSTVTATVAEESVNAAAAEETEEKVSEAAAEEAEEESTVIKVGTGSGYLSMWYVDDDGYLTGFCVEVLRAIDERLPQYEFEFETSSDLTGVLISLDANKVRIGEYLFNKNEERESKYLFGEEAYFHQRSYIGALADRDDLNTIDDFAGKVIGVLQGDSFTTVLEKYNEEHPGQEIILEYITWGTDEENLSLLTSGRVDGLCDISSDTVTSWNEAYGNGGAVVKAVGDPIIDEPSYLLFNKEDTELKEDVDGAIRELLEDGTLRDISLQFIGYDVNE